MSALAVRVVLLLAWVATVATDSSKPVSVVLHSSWPRTPILLEASEFVSQEDPLLFWRFVEGTQAVRMSATTDRAVYEAVLENAEQLLSPLLFHCLLLALSLHSQSPSVAMYQQLAEERRGSLQGGDRRCVPWVELGGAVLCSLPELTSAQEERNISTPEVFSFDHVYPSNPQASLSQPPTVILYCQLGTAECSQWHESLAGRAAQGTVHYVFRHQFEPGEAGGSQLSGYGVQLAVKNSEYKAVDDTQVKGGGSEEVEGEAAVEQETHGFKFHTLKLLHKDLSAKLEDFRLHLLLSAREIPELKAWQLQDLGLQAVQRAASSPPDLALGLLRDMAQNLPTSARSLCRVSVSKELRSEVVANQRSLQQYGMDPGDSVVFFNGIVLQTESADAFSILEVLQAESRLMEGLASLGLSTSDAHSVVQTSVHSQTQSFAVDMRSDSVVFVNNLESDPQYSGWTKSLLQFLQPSFPGTLRQVARNAFNLVFSFDPASHEGAELVEYVALFLDNLVPVRLGVLLVSEQEVGVAMARGFYYLAEHHSAQQALSWLIQVQSDGILSVEGVAAAMATAFPEAPQTVFTEDLQRQEEAAAFFEAKGLRSLPQVLLNGVQLEVEEDLETVIVSQLQQQTYLLQQWIFKKKVSDSTDLYSYFMQRPNVLQRLNHHITATNSLHLDLSAAPPNPMPALAQFHSLGSRAMSAVLAQSMFYYISLADEFAVRSLSLWLVSDLGSQQGRQATLSALSFLEGDSVVRLGLLHNPASPQPPALARAVVAVELNGWSSVSLLLSLLSSPSHDPLAAVEGLEDPPVTVSTLAAAMDTKEVDDVIASHMTYSWRVLGLRGGQTAVVANGRMVGPLAEEEGFSLEDYTMLAQLEASSHARAVAEALDGLAVEGISSDEDTAAFRSQLALKAASLLRSQPRQRRIPVPKLKGKHSGVHLPASEPLYHSVTAVLNPLDPAMQKWAHLLKVLRVVTPCDISIFLNPQSKLSEFPIKSFYRYVLEPELSFLPDGSSAPGPSAVFSQLPHSPLLTLHMDVPHSWLVAVLRSPHDLDNIHLQAVESAVHADFQLEHILVEGQLYDASSGHPVPGLELVLGPPSQPALYDTVVMANLGYFQLKASPGAWRLQIRDGRSSDIYHIVGQSGQSGLSVAVRSFSGEVHVVRVEKRKGMEEVRLLYDDDDNSSADGEKESPGSVWDTLSSLIGGSSKKEQEQDEGGLGLNETINVFSIASGHLYERFLRIMMLSVLKHTQHPVKFWFLENYLSPTFKDFIPHMAQHYGFQYELVQYKWPRWLHQQTEKQRLIWGYKILFLDVLFPLSVKKIIFVDADQIVRADLAELLQVPLEGAPYGYTPFCNDHPEMDGFRFWERGYWKSHLGSRRYHISALYVVDLVRFRQLAAGDRLRGQYQALSQDPNSLSNLDQDLPNNMVHQVPIHSLPQEWLWCETWCSQASKAAAKTIDLCNNPLTKEPKLASAVRIVAEWSSYDQEIRQLQDMPAVLEQITSANTHKHFEL